MAELAAGERVHDRAVTGAVACQHPLDADSVTAEEGNGAAEEAGGGRAFLVVEHLDVGKPGRDIDGDVYELPADPAQPRPPITVETVARARPIRPSSLTSMCTSSPGRGRS
jgi:hypothetical protein